MELRIRSAAQRPTTTPASAPSAVASAADLVRQLGREVGDVVAEVAILGEVGAATARQHGEAEVADLGAGIVEVVLASHLVADRLEHTGEEVPDERAARVADRERSGRVRRHELHVDATRGGARRAAKGGAGPTDLLDL